MGECWEQKYTQHVPSMMAECDNLYGWIKKKVTCTKIAPKMVNPRDIAGKAEREEEEKKGFRSSLKVSGLQKI